MLNRCCRHIQASPSSSNTDTTKPVDVDKQSDLNTVKLMMYIFPRQFGLHNVFTSKVDSKQTTQKLQDYTCREDEITAMLAGKKGNLSGQVPKLPKRLRGAAKELTERLQVLHSRCSYTALLKHYCPTPLDKPTRRPRLEQQRKHAPESQLQQSLPSSGPQVRRKAKRHHRKSAGPSSQRFSYPGSHPVIDLASPPSHVSSFCQAVISTIIPRRFWADGDTKCHNMSVFLRKVDQFIKLRRYETISLHNISQDLKVSSIALVWGFLGCLRLILTAVGCGHWLAPTP